MALPDPRRIAATDMYGADGTARRRRIIRAEFVAGAFGATALGIFTLIRGSGAWIAVGAWLLGVGANYLPLALEAQRLSGPGALESEMEGVNFRQELRHATRAQLWIVLPFAIVLAAIAHRRRRPPE